MEETGIFAHSRNAAGQRHALRQHLAEVARTAATFAAPFKGELLAAYAGRLHDIGKIHPAWQDYLLVAESNSQRKGSGPDHKGAGALLAKRRGLDLLAFLIAGHHGSLSTQADLKVWLRQRQADTRTEEAITLATTMFPDLLSIPLSHPTHLQSVLEGEFFVRMLYSCLVDADFLDTERHFDSDRAQLRQVTSTWSDLWQQFATAQLKRKAEATSLNQARREIYEACFAKANLPPGFFRLTVPTGGGKTLSGLAFALRHAEAYQFQRIIYAIPYMSITEQTADVFRSIFAGDGVILEHHSGIALPDDPLNASPAAVWSRLATENWDAPIIVTTTVQLFESLMRNTPGACRKLHNIAGSIILLDETQMLPSHLLNTILDILQQLVTHYGCTIVLCTATQPALDDRQGFAGLRSVREIIDEPAAFFTRLARVSYQWPTRGERWSWEQVAEKMCEVPQVLTIVNTKRDALEAYQALGDPDAFHLSTLMCGAHRRAVLRDVRDRLNNQKPCRLVSTQLIEAGVDIDFPLVLRALAPLDSIIQAGGRANREGNLSQGGLVIVFEPLGQLISPGPYRVGTDTTRELLAQGPIDCSDLATIQRYFEKYYSRINRDEPNIQEKRSSYDYPEVAKHFRMITEETTTVVVPYQAPAQPTLVPDLLNAIQQQQHLQRSDWRRLQPYMVNLDQRAFIRAKGKGQVREVVPGLWAWQEQETYDPRCGLARELL